MKKQYKAPSSYCVKINAKAIIAGSLDSLGINDSGGSVGKADAWVKEDNSISDVNLWDNEW